MVSVPYHTHTFELPTATKEDIEAGTASDLAVTPKSLGKIAAKDKAAVLDIEATGTPSKTTYLRGDGTWAQPPGDGDMSKTAYDPRKISADIFNMDNMTEGENNKIFTDEDRNALRNAKKRNVQHDTSKYGNCLIRVDGLFLIKVEKKSDADQQATVTNISPTLVKIFYRNKMECGQLGPQGNRDFISEDTTFLEVLDPEGNYLFSLSFEILAADSRATASVFCASGNFKEMEMIPL